jgi:hypothetical protein
MSRLIVSGENGGAPRPTLRQNRFGVDISHLDFVCELQAAQLGNQASSGHRATISFKVPGKPRESDIPDKPYVAMAQSDQVLRHILAALKIVRVNGVAFEICRLSDDVVSEDGINDTLAVEQL